MEPHPRGPAGKSAMGAGAPKGVAVPPPPKAAVAVAVPAATQALAAAQAAQAAAAAAQITAAKAAMAPNGEYQPQPPRPMMIGAAPRLAPMMIPPPPIAIVRPPQAFMPGAGQGAHFPIPPQGPRPPTTAPLPDFVSDPSGASASGVSDPSASQIPPAPQPDAVAGAAAAQIPPAPQALEPLPPPTTERCRLELQHSFLDLATRAFIIIVIGRGCFIDTPPQLCYFMSSVI